MKRTALLYLLLYTCACAMLGQPYKSASLPIDERVEDLLSRMTVEEKLAQLQCPMGWTYDERQDTTGVGMLWATFRADPWTGRTLADGLTPHTAARRANQLQRHAVEHTRLGIPLFLAEETPHGHMAIGTTTFPTGLGLGATFSTRLMERMGQTIARELRSQGAHIAFGPVLDLARDPRWSRTEETMGEDTYLVGALGAALVRGMRAPLLSPRKGGRNPQSQQSLPLTGESEGALAVLKHLAAYGMGMGGQNGAAVSLGRNELIQDYLPPFRQAIEAGALGVMTAYGAIDGVPCTCNPWLLRQVLRDEWGFRGLVISDLYSINVLHNTLHVAASLEEAARMALEAGVDVDLGASAFRMKNEERRVKNISHTLEDEVQPQADERNSDFSLFTLHSSLIDNAVRRVLRLKFEMGLFEQPYVDEAQAEQRVHTEADVQLAREVARASITLLKNSPLRLPREGEGRAVLPLSKSQALAVVGPNADNVYAQLGDYTAPQPEGKVVTVRQGLLDKGFTLTSVDEADVIVCVVGGSSSRYAPSQSSHEEEAALKYLDTGAANSSLFTLNSSFSPDSGEGLDRLSLDLLGSQQALLDSLKRTGKPLVVVYIEGRPLLKNWAAEHADALLTAYYPGEQGGAALADVLAGDYNPAGRLPVSVPRSVGQLPVYYSRPLPQTHDYVEGTSAPLYPFGHGLSYTTFEIENARLKIEDAATRDGAAGNNLQSSIFNLQFTITNTGPCDGEEVPQVYIRKEGTGLVEPERQLVAFDRVFIPKGQSRTVTFDLDLPVPCTIMVGASSQDIRLTAPLTPPVRGEEPLENSVRGDIVSSETPPPHGGGWEGAVGDSLVVRKLHEWQDQKFGILLHWGLYSVPGIVESWSICDEDWIRRDTTQTYGQYKQWYWGLADDFRPSRFQPDQWADIARAAGMRYMLFTTKHHDGFCLFDSRETDFTTAHYDGRDFLRPVLQAFRSRGMMTGTYFSKPDWHAQTYWWDVYPTKGRNVNYPIAQYPHRWEQFKRYTYNQIEELMSGYGPLDILWLDGGWVCPENRQDIDMPAIAQMARHHQPGLIIVDRTIHGPYENYQTPERTIPDRLLPYPWESCIPLSDDWGWVPRPRWKSARQVINTLIEVVAKGGNLVLGIGPTADGLIEPEAESRLRQIGAWLQQYGRAIYGTRPAPYPQGWAGQSLPLTGESEGASEGALWFTTSKNGMTTYALLALPEGQPLPKTLTLPLPPLHEGGPGRGSSGQRLSVRLVSTGQKLRWTRQGDQVTVALPHGLPDEPLAIELTLP